MEYGRSASVQRLRLDRKRNHRLLLALSFVLIVLRETRINDSLFKTVFLFAKENIQAAVGEIHMAENWGLLPKAMNEPSYKQILQHELSLKLQV